MPPALLFSLRDELLLFRRVGSHFLFSLFAILRRHAAGCRAITPPMLLPAAIFAIAELVDAAMPPTAIMFSLYLSAIDITMLFTPAVPCMLYAYSRFSLR
jgi:hypothetical protein